MAEITSATAAGLFTEFYLGGGYIGLFAGSAGFGLALALLQLWVLRYGAVLVCRVVVFGSILAVRMGEFHVVYAFTGLFFVGIFVWLFSRAFALFGFSGILPIERR